MEQIYRNARVVMRDEDFIGSVVVRDGLIAAVDRGRVLLYASRALQPDESPTGLSVPAGFHLVSDGLNRETQSRLPPTGTTSCNVPVGITCADDESVCGANGTCLHQYLLPWTKGACAVANPTPNNCVPKDASLFRGPPEENPPGVNGYWVKACEVQEDCGRGYPYVCDPNMKACMPIAIIQMNITREVAFQPFCKSKGNRPPP